jgi:hypothetical protein
MALATHSQPASATPSDYFTASTRLQSSVTIASERGSFITSPSSLGTSASATPFNSASANLSSAAATWLQLEASFAAKMDNIVADIINLVDNLRKVSASDSRATCFLC